MKNLRENKGITLIAIVITIIVLLILVGVTIATLTEDNGILNQSYNAKNKNHEATIKEEVSIGWTAMQSAYTSELTKNASLTKKDYFNKTNLEKGLGNMGTVVGDVTYVSEKEIYFQYYRNADNENYYIKIENDIISIITNEEFIEKTTAPVLAADSSWYRATTARSSITSIEIKRNYTPTGSEKEIFYADKENKGRIKGYIIGSKLIIAGTDSKKIEANQYSRAMFGIYQYSSSVDITGMGSSGYIGISGFSNVTSITGLENIDTSKVTDMQFMFANLRVTSLSGIDKWDVSNVTDTSYMFYRSTSLTSIDLSGWNTTKLQNTKGMFAGYYTPGGYRLSAENYPMAIASIDLSGWDAKNLKNISYMFYRCESLQTVYANDTWNSKSVNNTIDVFNNCLALKGGNGTNWTSSYASDSTYARVDKAGAPGFFTQK